MKVNELMVWTWAGWEPLQFYRRLGGFHEAQEGNALWAEDWRAQVDSAECARKVAEAGINWVTTHFFKGFGLETEAEEIAATARMIENYHREGIRVFAYLQYGTVMPETIGSESEASWGRVDSNGRHDGHPYEYGDQYWRAKPCANKPGFRDYLLRCVDAAIGIGADGIWIDNLQADGCHCSYCQDAFQAFLGRHVADPWSELGLRDISRIAIPRSERPCDPVYQAWVRFRCEETRASLRLLAADARERKPGVIVAVNIGIGNHQRALLENGNWFGDLDCVDYTYAENGFFPGWKEGAIVSQHWPMGIAESMGIHIVPGAAAPAQPSMYPRPAVPNARELRLSFAESVMLGGHAFGGPYGLRGEDGGLAPVLMRDAEYRRVHRRLVDWYALHQSLFAGSRNASPVAVLYSREAMTGDERQSRQAFEAMVQLLQQQQIPFRYALSDRLDQLDGIKLLILPHVLPISDIQAGRLRAFVAAGGALLATGRTSLYDEQMRQRRDYALGDLLCREFSRDFEEANCGGVLTNPANGCILLPGEWGVTSPDGQPAPGIPDDRLVRLIRHAIGNAGMPEIFCPVPHVGCGWRRMADGRMLLALANYGGGEVHGITLHSLYGIGREGSMQFCAVDSAGVNLHMSARPAGGTRVDLPAVDVEAFVVIE